MKYHTVYMPPAPWSLDEYPHWSIRDEGDVSIGVCFTDERIADAFVEILSAGETDLAKAEEMALKAQAHP